MIENAYEPPRADGMPSPTIDIQRAAKAFAGWLLGTSLVGGVSMGPQIQNLARGADVVVATPGRLLDHMDSRRLRLDATEVVVLALRGTEPDFREPVLASMASRSRRLVESELANPSSAPPAEISKARKQIVKLVLSMSQRGEIDLPAGDSGEGA